LLNLLFLLFTILLFNVVQNLFCLIDDAKIRRKYASFQVFSSISVEKHATHASYCDKGGKCLQNLSQKSGKRLIKQLIPTNLAGIYVLGRSIL